LAAIPISAFVVTIPPSGDNCSRSCWNRVHVPMESTRKKHQELIRVIEL
jgi:hypothetical protein